LSDSPGTGTSGAGVVDFSTALPSPWNSTEAALIAGVLGGAAVKVVSVTTLSDARIVAAGRSWRQGERALSVL